MKKVSWRARLECNISFCLERSVQFRVDFLFPLRVGSWRGVYPHQATAVWFFLSWFVYCVFAPTLSDIMIETVE
jgi:hypothetical protein